MEQDVKNMLAILFTIAVIALFYLSIQWQKKSNNKWLNGVGLFFLAFWIAGVFMTIFGFLFRGRNNEK